MQHLFALSGPPAAEPSLRRSRVPVVRTSKRSAVPPEICTHTNDAGSHCRRAHQKQAVAVINIGSALVLCHYRPLPGKYNTFFSTANVERCRFERKFQNHTKPSVFANYSFYCKFLRDSMIFGIFSYPKTALSSVLCVLRVAYFTSRFKTFFARKANFISNFDGTAPI